MGRTPPDVCTAVITGGNTLLEHEQTKRGSVGHVDLTLACRSLERAEAARAELLQTFPDAHIELLRIDTSRPLSVRAACDEYKRRHDRLDFLFANAGVMLIRRVNWLALARHLALCELAYFLETSGRFLEQPVNARTPEGLGEVFACNVLGHYLMIQHLKSELSNGGRIFWTGSSTSKDTYFDMEDFQCVKGIHPYQSSKYALDLLSHALNLELNSQGIYSINTAPGTMISGIALSQFPEWLFTVTKPLFVLGRLATTNLTVSGYNAVESIISLLDKKPASLDLRLQYVSCTGFWGSSWDGTGGTRYVSMRDTHIRDSDALEFKNLVAELAKPFL